MFPQIVWNCLAGTAWLPIVFLAISNASAAAGGAATTDPGVVVIKEAHLAVTLPPPVEHDSGQGQEERSVDAFISP